MTRKRFVKLLMSAGYSRNEAVDYAATCLSHHASYRSMYLDWLINRDNPEFAEALTRLCEAAAEAIRNVASAIAAIDWSEAVETMAEFSQEATEGNHE